MRTRRLAAGLSTVAVLVTTAPLAAPSLAAAPQAPGAAVRPAAATAPQETLPRRVRGKDWTVLPLKQKAVALTIDCGANASGMRSINRTLKQTGVPATFFVTGNWANTYPKKLKTIARRGFPIGNHTKTHPRVSALSDAALASQVSSTESTVERIAGVDVKPWFRFPYGARRLPYDVNRLNALGYIPISWTVDTAGWMGTSGGMSVSSILRRVFAGATKGEIVLMHCGSNPNDGSTLDADALPSIISGFRDRGYRFTTVEALLDPKGAPYVD